MVTTKNNIEINENGIATKRKKYYKGRNRYRFDLLKVETTVADQNLNISDPAK